MICKKCSATLPDDSVFCNKCGSRLDGKKHCIACEKIIEEGSIFCSYCGAKQNENTVSHNELSTKNTEKEDGILHVTPIITPAISPVDNETIDVTSKSIFKNEDNKATENEKENIEETSEADSEELEVVEPLICTQCGSNDIELISENMGICKNCGTQIIINSPKENNYISNNVTINMTGNDTAKAISFFELPKEIDEKTFYVKALTKIAIDKYSPDDIFVAGSFMPVKTEYRQYLLGKGTAKIAYSATIGYDRQEQYREYDSVKKEYVTKTRTVTDWKPFSGSHTGEYIEATANDDNSDALDAQDYKKYCLESAKEYDANTSKFPAPLSPTSTSIHNLKAEMFESAENDCIAKLPGDKKKDFNCNGVVDLNILESHVATQYILKYNYLNEQRILKSHSCKKSSIIGEIPSAKKQIESEIENNKLVKSFNILTLCTLLFSILSSILFPIALKIIFVVIGIASFITYWVLRPKISKKIYLEKKQRKKQTLIYHLKKKGIEIPKNLLEGE